MRTLQCISVCVCSTKEFNKVRETLHGLHTLRSFTRYHFGKLYFLFVLHFYTIALAVAALCFCPLFILALQIVLVQLLYRAIKSYLLIAILPSYAVDRRNRYGKRLWQHFKQMAIQFTSLKFMQSISMVRCNCTTTDTSGDKQVQNVCTCLNGCR